MNIVDAITPKSDQLNADDLIAGPVVIKITSVEIVPGDQPVVVHYENENGKPWKPCKSMARVMVKAWGPDANEYAGRSLKLYLDPSVKWAGVEVGGIRIAAISDIEAPLKMNLTASRGKRKPFSAEVLVPEQELPTTVAQQLDNCKTMDELRELWGKLPPETKETMVAYKDKAKQKLEKQNG